MENLSYNLRLWIKQTLYKFIIIVQKVYKFRISISYGLEIPKNSFPSFTNNSTLFLIHEGYWQGQKIHEMEQKVEAAEFTNFLQKCEKGKTSCKEFVNSINLVTRWIIAFACSKPHAGRSNKWKSCDWQSLIPIIGPEIIIFYPENGITLAFVVLT